MELDNNFQWINIRISFGAQASSTRKWSCEGYMAPFNSFEFLFLFFWIGKFMHSSIKLYPVLLYAVCPYLNVCPFGLVYAQSCFVRRESKNNPRCRMRESTKLRIVFERLRVTVVSPSVASVVLWTQQRLPKIKLVPQLGLGTWPKRSGSS